MFRLEFNEFTKEQRVNPARTRMLNSKSVGDGPVVYWMNRDMRLDDNWAVVFAFELATQYNKHVEVVYNLHPSFLGGGARQLDFKLSGLRDIETRARELQVPFHIVEEGDDGNGISDWIATQNPGILVTDFSPLRIQVDWVQEVTKMLPVQFWQVDAHNIIPCWVTTDKQEFAARTIRPKIQDKLPSFLTEFPTLKKQRSITTVKEINWNNLSASLRSNSEVTPIDWAEPGATAAIKALKSFTTSLKGYDQHRNDPNQDAQSNLSPYYHYGQLSPQRAALEVAKSGASKSDVDAYLEELIVRRELSDNFCYYNNNYDNIKGAADWARTTLEEHRDDPREYTYTAKEFEQAKTHDDLWNAAQLQMVKSGKMHGYMRMYWAKKILEWTNTPEYAIRIAIDLNDKYEIDGRDPNGYVGILWSIAGLHDRAWPERPIYGKIRYMNKNGASRKFDTDAYVNRWVG